MSIQLPLPLSYLLGKHLLCKHVSSIAPRKNFGALTTAPKFQYNGSADLQHNGLIFPVMFECR